MTPELDALIIRSLPELDAAATRLDDLSDEIGRVLDAEVAAWIARNGWSGVAGFFGEPDTTWLAPNEWKIPGGEDKFYLNFGLEVTEPEIANYWNVSNLVGCGQERLGFWLYYNGVGRNVYKRLWREFKASAGLPLLGSEFFLPIVLDRETLATALEKGMVSDALQPLHDALDRLPQLVSQLEPFKQAIAAAAAEKP